MPLLLLLLGVIAIVAPRATAFNYSAGGTNWPGLCRAGEHQSPVHIVRGATRLKRGLNVNIAYQVSNKFTLVNNGDNILVKPDPATRNILNFNGEDYILQQIHGHDVSEHAFDGYFTPFELHLVHASAANPNKLLVLATLFRLDATDRPNPFLEKWVPRAPLVPNTTIAVNEPLSFAEQIAPSSAKGVPGEQSEAVLYTYMGSLTTPTCKEGVRWVVVDPQNGPTIAVPQLESFQEIVADLDNGVPDNNRDPQRLWKRKVLRFLAHL